MPHPDPELEQIVRDWLAAKQAARTDDIEARLSGYDGALAVGTEAAEWWSGADAFRKAHLSGGEFVATIEALDAHREGDVGWVAARVVFQTGEPGGLPIRVTLVLVRESGDWRIVQSHASTPD